MDVVTIDEDAAIDDQGVAQLDPAYDPSDQNRKGSTAVVGNNYQDAVRRIVQLRRKLQQQRQYDEYDATIKEQTSYR